MPKYILDFAVSGQHSDYHLYRKVKVDNVKFAIEESNEIIMDLMCLSMGEDSVELHGDATEIELYAIRDAKRKNLLWKEGKYAVE